MKQSHLILSIAALLALASCDGQSSSTSPSSEQSCSTCGPCQSQEPCSSCEPCQSQEPVKMTYGHYTLKDSVTDLTEIEGYPWINSNTVGMLGKVEKPEAKHDFFGHANYERFENNPLPEGADRDGGKIMESSDVTDDHIEEIMNSDNADVQAILRMLKEGAKEKILEDVSDFLNPETAASSAQSFAKSKAIFEGPSRLVYLQVDESGKVHLSYAVNLQNINFALILYLASTTQKVQQYFEAIIAYLEVLGLDEEVAGNLFNSAAVSIIAAINAFAKASVEFHDTTIGQMDFDFGCIDLKAALLDLGLPEDTEVTISDQACQFLSALGSADLNTLASIAAISRLFDNRFCVGAADYRELAVTHFADLQGLEAKDIKGDSTDEEVARSLYLKGFPKAFDQVYIDKFIKASTKERVDDLIDDIIAEYNVVFDEKDWLSDETKEAAKEKLGNMWHMSFYSDGFMDEDKRFQVNADDAMALAGDYREWYAGIMSSCPWSGSVITAGMSTTTVNAMYSTIDNAFAIFHGVCASYIGDEDLSTEELYGFVGMVIGHEISHGFDSDGANYDKNGQKHDWWTAEDRGAFQASVGKIANYYTNSVHGYRDHNYNGSKLTGEVIADMGGVSIMLRLAEKQESFNYDEFFRAIAENFACQETRERGIDRITTDMHPEEYLRINVTLSQFDEFAETYDVKEGDGMYVAPQNRLAIW